MEQAKEKLQDIQTKLTILAAETTTRSNSLIKYLQKFQKGETKYQKLILRRVASLLERSEHLLDEASETYKAVSTHYIKTQTKLEQFQNTYLDRLTIEMETSSNDLKSRKKWGRILYSLNLGECILNFVQAIRVEGGEVVDVLSAAMCSLSSIKLIDETETDISSLKKSFSAFKSTITKTGSIIAQSIENVGRKQRTLKQEKKIAKKWKEHVTSILTTHEKDLGELMIEENLMLVADEVIDEFKKLKCHSNNYLVYKQCTEDCDDLPVSEQTDCIKACKTALKPCTIIEV
eukprot:GFUD01123880.1.p1 GENE.GFUD01123880.1~~GFUD01123880.1.p1  ORF type:complete len:304 (+),score=55.35 GFUD01123880.1:44-913(+)